MHIYIYIYIYLSIEFLRWGGESERNGTKRKKIMLLYICRNCLEPFGVHYLYAGHPSTITLVLLVAVFGILKRVPLSDRTSRGCQHVGPVSQFCSTRVVPQDDLPNGFWRADTIVVDYRDNQLHFLNVKSRVSALVFSRGQDSFSRHDLRIVIQMSQEAY